MLAVELQSEYAYQWALAFELPLECKGVLESTMGFASALVYESVVA